MSERCRSSQSQHLQYHVHPSHPTITIVTTGHCNCVIFTVVGSVSIDDLAFRSSFVRSFPVMCCVALRRVGDDVFCGCHHNQTSLRTKSDQAANTQRSHNNNTSRFFMDWEKEEGEES
mmetsp:Transcript_13326/g.36834  ORF Transcript_13326/g.36834 Transcript_13326/m.36834 type:complete len:118 (+) Transcript_13326:863-1216(+)